MTAYIKQCRPFKATLEGQGFCSQWTPLEDWQDANNENMLREKYPESKLDGGWAELVFQYRYIEIEI